MVKISVVIPVYNEVKFIQKTLESVVGDADEIILSDNASTDGTSDICQSFANRYPEIKYTRHKENKGSMENFLFCFNQTSGKYIRNIGAHDMISIGSNQSMASLLDKHADAVMVYPKYVIGLNENYSYKYFHVYNEFGDELLSDSALVRTKSMMYNLKEFSIWFGLWRAEVFHGTLRPRIFQRFFTDRTQLALTAAKGKMLADEKSVFFRMNPRSKQTADETQERYASMILNTKKTDAHPSFWNFAVIAEIHDFILEMFNNNPKFCQEILHLQLDRFVVMGGAFFRSEFTLKNMPPIIPEKQEFCQNLMTYIKKYYYKNIIRNPKAIIKMTKRRVNVILKFILPHGFYKWLRKRF